MNIFAASDEMTIVNWEKGHTKPRINHMARVVEFLGFSPFANGDNLAQRLVNYRTALGLTQKAFAKKIQVDPSTLARWERGEREPRGQTRGNVEEVAHIRLSTDRSAEFRRQRCKDLD